MNLFSARLLIIFTALLQVFLLSPAWCLETINLQLKWIHCFQFAGYYAAKEMGYYEEADLDVRFIEASSNLDPAQSVLNGDAQYGIGTSTILLQRAEKKPLVVLAVIFQHSPYILISSLNRGIHDIHDLVGKKIMLESQSDELVAYLRKEGISKNDTVNGEPAHGIQDLVNGKIDAMSAYSTYEPYFLNLTNFSYQFFSPRSAGIDFYGDNLFTTEKELSDNPDRVKRLRTASLKGWRYAIDNSEQIINLIISKYAPGQSIDFLRFEAKQIKQLMHSELVEIGYMHAGRWKHILETYADLKMLPPGFSLEGFIYNPNPTVDHTILYLTIIASLIVIFIISSVTIKFINLNNKLRISEEHHRFLVDNA
ncbi:MAG: ABC transporter substrate-binding protein, partial [Deltaproteobacteria bacterium]|nr:ABC transporter substrate-binding protein [Deltaproteobacteria bacterium]